MSDLFRRAAKAAIPRSTITIADLATALRLLGSLLIAWSLPQAWWPYLARKDFVVRRKTHWEIDDRGNFAHDA